jgi:WD40 repeat protein
LCQPLRTLTDAYTLLLTDRGTLKSWDWKTNKVKTIHSFSRDGTITSLNLSTRQRSKVAIGTEDCYVHMLNLSNNKTSKIQTQQPVTEAAWDPRSENYILVAQKDGKISLYDVETLKEMSVFTRHSGGLRALAWVPEIPGGFVTVSERNGVIRLWNVSQVSRKVPLVAFPEGSLSSIP